VRKPLALLLFLLFLILNGLEARNSHFSLGLKAGVNLANISVASSDPGMPDFKNLAGMMVGVFFSFELGSVAIQPEFFLARRGTKYETFIDNDLYPVAWPHDYLEALLLLKWSVIKSGRVRPFILAGPSYGYLSKATSVIYDNEGHQLASVDSSDYFRKNVLALVFGAGLEITVRRFVVSLETRYHLGLSNLALSGLEVDSLKNRSLSLLAGLSF